MGKLEGCLWSSLDYGEKQGVPALTHLMWFYRNQKPQMLQSHWTATSATQQLLGTWGNASVGLTLLINEDNMLCQDNSPAWGTKYLYLSQHLFSSVWPLISCKGHPPNASGSIRNDRSRSMNCKHCPPNTQECPSWRPTTALYLGAGGPSSPAWDFQSTTGYKSLLSQQNKDESR